MTGKSLSSRHEAYQFEAMASRMEVSRFAGGVIALAWITLAKA